MSNITIILKDKKKSVTISFDKHLMPSSNEYFNKLLSNNFKESSQKEITLEVEDAFQANIHLMNLLNKNTCDDLLANARIADYWGIPFDLNLHDDIHIDNFDKLIELASITGCDDRMIKLINDHIKAEYDFTKLSNELITSLINIRKDYRLFSASDDGTASEFSTKLNKKIYQTDRPTRLGQLCIAISPDGSMMAIYQKNHVVILNRTDNISDTQKSYDTKLKINQRIEFLRYVFFSPNDKYISISDSKSNNESHVYVYEIATGLMLCDISVPAWGTKIVKFSHDSKYVVYYNYDKVIFHDISNTSDDIIFVGHDDKIFDIALSPDGLNMASCSIGDTIIIWNISSKNILQNINKRDYTFDNIDYSPCGSFIIATGDDVRIWSVTSGKLVHSLEMKCRINISRYSPDGKYIALGTHDGHIQIYDTETFEIVNDYSIHFDNIKQICWRLVPDKIVDKLQLALQTA